MATTPPAKLAYRAAEHFIRTQSSLAGTLSPAGELHQQKACYVTLYENPGRRFRSMYGAPLPTQPTLAQEIVAHTIQAMQQDPSRQVRQADLRDLVFSVAVIHALERISGPEQLDPVRDGLYLRSDRSKGAVILPQRSGVETAEDQLATAIREAAINPEVETFTLYRFRVTYFE